MENWIYTMLEEQNIDLEEILEVEGEMYGTNYIPVEVVVEHILITSDEEQKAIKEMITKIISNNCDVLDYLKHLAKAIAI